MRVCNYIKLKKASLLKSKKGRYLTVPALSFLNEMLD